MRDRLSTKILDNGATRYGVYDETGKLLRYEYIKLEDEPTVEGDFFSKANMLPDSIPALLGLKMANPQVKDALNVLANIGNLHVWERVQTYAEEQHTYTLGEKATGVALATGTGAGYQQIWYCSDKITVSDSLEISLVSPSTVSFYANTTTEEFMSAVAGKFIKYKGHGSEEGLTLSYAGVYFCPGDSAFGNVQYSQYAVYKGITNAQIVTAVTIPAGTSTDYLTSTDPDAYPKQSAEGGQDAYYTLMSEIVGAFGLGRIGTSIVMRYEVSDSVNVSEDGIASLANPSTVSIGTGWLGSLSEVQDTFLGKFVCRTNDGDATWDNYTNYSKVPLNEIVYIPSDASITLLSGTSTSDNIIPNFVLDKYQPVTGHAAIPANTTITYLGQLGGGARIEVGSYVGTGTYGSNNPNSLTFGFEPNMVMIFAADRSYNVKMIINESVVCNILQSNNSTYLTGFSSITKTEKTITWYYSGSTSTTANSQSQLNASGVVYYYFAIG